MAVVGSPAFSSKWSTTDLGIEHRARLIIENRASVEEGATNILDMLDSRTGVKRDLFNKVGNLLGGVLNYTKNSETVQWVKKTHRRPLPQSTLRSELVAVQITDFLCLLITIILIFAFN